MTAEKVPTKKVAVKKQTTAADDESNAKAVKIGFTVAMLHDGELVFNLHGAPGIIELQGLLAFAHKVGDVKFKEQLSIEDVAVMKAVNALELRLKAVEGHLSGIEFKDVDVEQEEVVA